MSRVYKRGGGNYHSTIDLLFDWFGISCMTTDNFCFYLQNRLIQTSILTHLLYLLRRWVKIFHKRKSMFAGLHSDINSHKSSLLHLTSQPYWKKSRSAKVKDGIINFFLGTITLIDTTSQTGGQRYSDTSPFSNPCFVVLYNNIINILSPLHFHSVFFYFHTFSEVTSVGFY